MSRSTHVKSKRAGAPAHRLRIIGGRWRGVSIQFPPLADIRPTPDRVRETLFNWLQQPVLGARCLDLFAGSGALGLEALSRGAAHVTFVERNPEAARSLRETLEKLKASGAQVLTLDAAQFLRGSPRPYDVVFLDPPFAADLLAPSLRALEAGWLSDTAYVYVECPVDAPAAWAASAWHVHRSKRAGQVGYHLLRPTTAVGETP